MNMQGICAYDLLIWKVNWVKLIEPGQSTPTALKFVIQGYVITFLGSI